MGLKKRIKKLHKLTDKRLENIMQIMEAMQKAEPDIRKQLESMPPDERRELIRKYTKEDEGAV